MFRRILFIALPLAGLSQTQVDLRTQSKSVDFTGAAYTRPVKTGTVLPATCSTGDLFFNTSAAAGSNLFACVSTNTWALQSGAGGITTFQTGGSTTSSASLANFVAGSGILLTGTSPGGNFQLQISPDTSVIPTKANLQAGATMTLTETSISSSAYTTTTNPVFSALPSGAGQLPVWSWKVGTGCSGGGLTMQVNTLPAGPAPLLNPDGSNPTATQCAAGQKLLVTYDSAANSFVIVGGEAATVTLPVPTAGEIYWPLGVVPVNNWAGGELVAAQGSANTGIAYIASCQNSSGCYSSTLRFYVQTVAATGKGVQVAYYSPDLTTQWCVSTVATGSTLTSTGWKSVTWASGTKVSGGVCIVPVGGYEIVITSDDTSIKVGANSDVGQASGLSAGATSSQTCAVGFGCRSGYSGSAISSGAGASLTLASNLSSTSWVVLNGANVVPAIVVLH